MRATGPDPLTPFADYVAQRFTDDPHVWATVLFDEVVDLGFDPVVLELHPAAASPGVAPAL